MQVEHAFSASGRRHAVPPCAYHIWTRDCLKVGRHRPVGSYLQLESRVPDSVFLELF